MSSSQNAAPVVELRGITKSFYTDEVETRAVNAVDMVIENQDFVSITGPSGCGKSTLLSILGLLDAPTSGAYRLNGEDIVALSPSQKARVRNKQIGFIFQEFNLLGDLTVFENVELPLVYQGVPKTERVRRVNEALEQVSMKHREKHYPNQLSGGQQQRVAVARALAPSPAVLLADEPTGNLDSQSANAVIELLRQLNRAGSTICMVTHDPRFAEAATRQIRLFDGQVQAG